ncbi:MAG: hypothetical protein MJ244_04825 [Clostridia bacterium]|nr:hypothetical protein [Clostridia bacterium]
MKIIKKILVGMLTFVFTFLLCANVTNAADKVSAGSNVHLSTSAAQDSITTSVNYDSSQVEEITYLLVTESETPSKFRVSHVYDANSNASTGQAKIKQSVTITDTSAPFTETIHYKIYVYYNILGGLAEEVHLDQALTVEYTGGSNQTTQSTQPTQPTQPTNEPFELSPSRHTIEFINNKQVKVFVNKKQGATVDSVELVGFQTIANDPNVDITQGTYTSTGNGNGYMTFSVTNKNVDEAWEETRNLTIQITYKVGGVEYTCNLPYELILRYNKDGAFDQTDDADDDDDDVDGDDVTLYGDPDDLSRILDVNDGVGKVVYDFALLVAAILTFLGIMWVGVNIVMARANGEQRSSSMQGLMYIVIGIIILDIVLVLYGLLGDLVGDPESEVDELDVTVVGGDED